MDTHEGALGCFADPNGDRNRYDGFSYSNPHPGEHANPDLNPDEHTHADNYADTNTAG